MAGLVKPSAAALNSELPVDTAGSARRPPVVEHILDSAAHILARVEVRGPILLTAYLAADVDDPQTQDLPQSNEFKRTHDLAAKATHYAKQIDRIATHLDIDSVLTERLEHLNL